MYKDDHLKVYFIQRSVIIIRMLLSRIIFYKIMAVI